MAGTFTADLLADGQLPTTKGTLYTVPALTTAYVRTIKLFNTNAVTQTIILYINGGTSRKTYRLTLAQNESAEDDDRITLGAGDTIEAETTTATAVDYTIHGVEET